MAGEDEVRDDGAGPRSGSEARGANPWRGSVDPDVELLSNQRIRFDNATVDIKFSGDNFMPYYEQTMMVFEARFAQW